jgi:hypothetical protein
MPVARAAAVVVLVIASSCIRLTTASNSTAKSPAPPPREAVKAACKAYETEIRQTDPDPIVDFSDPSIKDRLTLPSEPHKRTADIPKEVLEVHGWGSGLVGYVVERDGTISNVKLLIPSAYPAYDRVFLKSVQDSSFGRGATLDGEPVRMAWSVEFVYGGTH